LSGLRVELEPAFVSALVAYGWIAYSWVAIVKLKPIQKSIQKSIQKPVQRPVQKPIQINYAT
jgi:predicted DNA-binding transcriptional regulator